MSNFNEYLKKALELHKNKAIEDLTDKKQKLMDYLSMGMDDEVMNDMVQKTLDGINSKLKTIEDIAKIKELT